MINFSDLVLAPCQEVFGRMFTLDPRQSRPGEAPYAARGIFSSTPMDVMTLEGVAMSDQRTTLGIRLAEYPVPPKAEDRVLIDEIEYWISDVHVDGQGGMTLTLRKTGE